ncbi:MAG TPA: metallophosphoesterase [Terracidiphilus sp.]|nr:metallophosphoesterase [Terracidiphilus sp.]
MSNSSFAFANPTYTADDFITYSAGDIEADAKLKEIQAIEPIPAPRLLPPVFDIGAVLPASVLSQIRAAGQLVFHSVGDTGGVVKAEPQLAVADAMAADLANKTYATALPAFFFHLGDVVYYFGQEQYYPEQFYDPYRNYDAPIFAIPGNHDGVMYKDEPVSYSLEAFMNNFCAASPTIGISGFSRTTMVQPGAYFVLTAPFVRFIGLYSNAGESVGVLGDATIGNDQVTFLEQQLAAALAARNSDPKSQNPEALIVAVHHPPFTGASDHFPSASMLQQIDISCQQAGIWPDLVLSGHAHLYERYTRTMKSDGRQIPYLVAGNGGYYNLSKLKTNTAGDKPAPGGQTEPDGQGNSITLEQFNDTNFGFLRLTVNSTSIVIEALAVTSTNITTSTTTPIPPPTVVDRCIVDLTRHTVSTASAVRSRAGAGKKAIGHTVSRHAAKK